MELRTGTWAGGRENVVTEEGEGDSGGVWVNASTERGVLSRSLLVARLGPPTVEESSGSHVAISVSITGFSCWNEIPSHTTENYL